MQNHLSKSKIAVVVPCYRVKNHIQQVISDIPQEIYRIYIIDDCCPENSGKFVEETINDSRVKVIYNKQNLGVGGAVMVGYKVAINDGAEVIVKVDGDGQMDPSLIQYFVEPILNGEADYTKGNRFFDLEEIHSMPTSRLFGNAILSLMAKLSTGYWNLFDPTNGYTAIHADVAKHLPFGNISNRYFFETDILFRLNIMQAVVVDIPMDAKYGSETSNLKISKIIGEFLFKHARNFLKRIFYNYYLRNMSLASLELPIGLLLFLFGLCFGGSRWIESVQIGSSASAGTVMLAALPILTGIQFIMAFIGYDVSSVPKRVRHKSLGKYKKV